MVVVQISGPRPPQTCSRCGRARHIVPLRRLAAVRADLDKGLHRVPGPRIEIRELIERRLHRGLGLRELCDQISELLQHWQQFRGLL